MHVFGEQDLWSTFYFIQIAGHVCSVKYTLSKLVIEFIKKYFYCTGVNFSDYKQNS